MWYERAKGNNFISLFHLKNIVSDSQIHEIKNSMQTVYHLE